MTETQLKNFITDLQQTCLDIKILINEPMAAHCSFRIGGPCDAMLFPRSVNDILYITQALKAMDETPIIIGNGTNLLVNDEPFHHIVLRFGEEFSAIEQSENQLTSQCGVTLSKLATYAAEQGLSGLEFAHGIPGTLGGAVSMNAGAYGGEMKDVLRSVTYLDENLNLHETSDLDLSYRHSRFSDSQCILLSATMELQSGNTTEIKAKMQELMEKRRSSQPLDVPSAGSTFKRPVGAYAAALIDQAGLRGYRLGGAMVSDKHCGFVVNIDHACYSDVTQLISYIQNRVYQTSGIQIEPEVKIWNS